MNVEAGGYLVDVHADLSLRFTLSLFRRFLYVLSLAL